jgi:hypothetical protein
MGEAQEGGRLGFLDSVARLFRREEEVPASAAGDAGRLDAFQAEFEAALRALDEKIEASVREAEVAGTAAGPSRRKTAQDRAAEQLRRLDSVYRAIREDIEKMHARLGTGLTAAELDTIHDGLEELAPLVRAGRSSHALVPRARCAIAERLQAETGELAVARLVELLRAAQMPWPDPTRYRPSASEDEIERSRSRRLAEVREVFLGHDIQKTADRMLGMVKAWADDYPERGSPLWEECVLEGVAAGIRGQIALECTELLRRDRDQLLAEIEALIGKDVAALQKSVQSGVTSIEQASRAAASALRVLDEVAPELAWEHVRSEVPHARGEWGA